MALAQMFFQMLWEREGGVNNNQQKEREVEYPREGKQQRFGGFCFADAELVFHSITLHSIAILIKDVWTIWALDQFLSQIRSWCRGLRLCINDGSKF